MFYREEDNDGVEKLLKYRSEDGQGKCLADQIMADFGNGN